MDELPALDQVPDDPRVVGGRHVERLLQSHGARVPVGDGADAADPLGDEPGIPGVPPLQDDLEAAEQGPGAPGVLDLAVLHLHLDAQVPLDAGNRVDHDSLCHGSPSRPFLMR